MGERTGEKSHIGLKFSQAMTTERGGLTFAISLSPTLGHKHIALGNDPTCPLTNASKTDCRYTTANVNIILPPPNKFGALFFAS